MRVRFGGRGSIRGVYPYALPDLYAELNDRFWGGRLPPALRTPMYFHEDPRSVKLRRVPCFWDTAEREGLAVGNGQHAFGAFYPPGPHASARIRIAAPLPPDKERRVLLHEMIHCELWFSGFSQFTGRSHGPHFAYALARLAAKGEEWARADAEIWRDQP